MSVSNDESLRFQRFHDLVMNGMDYEDAIKEAEGLTGDYILSDADRELFNVLFEAEIFLKRLEDIPELLRPKEELGLLSEKLNDVLQER